MRLEENRVHRAGGPARHQVGRSVELHPEGLGGGIARVVDAVLSPFAPRLVVARQRARAESSALLAYDMAARKRTRRVQRASSADQDLLNDLVNRAVAGASQGVMHVAVPRRQNQATPTLSHDQVQHHHQQ